MSLRGVARLAENMSADVNKDDVVSRVFIGKATSVAGTTCVVNGRTYRRLVSDDFDPYTTNDLVLVMHWGKGQGIVLGVVE